MSNTETAQGNGTVAVSSSPMDENCSAENHAATPMDAEPDFTGQSSTKMEIDQNNASSATGDTSITVTYGAKKQNFKVNLDEDVLDLKKKVAEFSSVPSNMQKLIYKGNMLRDGDNLRQYKILDGSKIMLVGSQLKEIAAVNQQPATSEIKDEETKAPTKEPLCRQKQHLKIIEQGIPDDAMPGIKNVQDPLPSIPISGMVNKHGGKVRLTFKLEMDQVWIGTKERTEKIPMNQIKSVISEPIVGHEEYNIMALQLGPTEQSRVFFYWVPAQYVDAIKAAILGG